MSQWKINPEQVQGVLTTVQSDAQAVVDEVAEEKFTSLSEDLSIRPTQGGALRNGLFGSVENAVGNVLNDQKADLESVFARIEAGVKGVIATTSEYVNADGDMAKAAAAQAAMVAVDIPFFDQYDFGEQK